MVVVNPSSSSTAHVYDIDAGTWTEIPGIGRHNARVVSTPDSFLVVGGSYTQGLAEYPYDSIFEFDPTGMDWIEREETLQTARFLHHVVPVDREKFCPE